MSDAVDREMVLGAIQLTLDTGKMREGGTMAPLLDKIRDSLCDVIRALPQQEGPAPAAVAVVEQQARDEGLWFVAETAAEAYLQQELRRLHSAVEASALPQQNREARLREALEGLAPYLDVLVNYACTTKEYAPNAAVAKARAALEEL